MVIPRSPPFNGTCVRVCVQPFRQVRGALVKVCGNGPSETRAELVAGSWLGDDPFLSAKAAEGASPRTIEWYRMITARLAGVRERDLAVDGPDPAELRRGPQSGSG